MVYTAELEAAFCHWGVPYINGLVSLGAEQLNDKLLYFLNIPDRKKQMQNTEGWARGGSFGLIPCLHEKTILPQHILAFYSGLYIQLPLSTSDGLLSSLHFHARLLLPAARISQSFQFWWMILKHLISCSPWWRLIHVRAAVQCTGSFGCREYNQLRHAVFLVHPELHSALLRSLYPHYNKSF